MNDIRKDLRVGRWAAVGEEGQPSHAGKIVEFKGGVVTLQLVDAELGFLCADRYHDYDILSIADYTFCVDVNDTFSDPEGNQYDFLTHLRLWAEDWNSTGFDHNH